MNAHHKYDLTIIPYRSKWKNDFAEESALLREVLGNKSLRIEHIGSTSIPGMQAKPVIDMMVAVETLTKAIYLVPVLDELNYVYRHIDTVPGRLFFGKEEFPDHRSHHLNLTEEGSEFWINQLAFRDYLRKNESVAAEYIDLKQRLAEYTARTGLIDRDWKTEFVLKVLELIKMEANTPG